VDTVSAAGGDGTGWVKVPEGPGGALLYWNASPTLLLTTFLSVKSFFRRVEALFQPELGPIGFYPDRIWKFPDLVIFHRPHSNSLVVTAYVRDFTRSHQNTNIGIGISPIDGSTDDLGSSGLGCRVLVASTYNPDDEFLRAAARKIKHFSAAVGSLADAVQAELGDPYFETPRLQIWRQEERFVQEFLAILTSSEHAQLREAAADLARTGRNLDVFVATLVARIDSIVNTKRESISVPDYFERGGPEALVSPLLIHFAFEAMFELGRALQKGSA
jgi:hypothetical protein